MYDRLRKYYSQRVAMGLIGWTSLFITEAFPPKDTGIVIKEGTVPPSIVLYAATSLPYIQWLVKNIRYGTLYNRYYPSKLEKIGFGMLMIGVALQQYCRSVMGKHYTFSVSIKPEHTVCAQGPYSYIRHPGYLSAIMMFGGSFLFCQNIAGLLCMAPSIVLNFILAPEEEAFLKDNVDGYSQYLKDVKYRIIPYIY